MTKPIIKFASALFARGIETYNSVTKTQENLGGAQLFRIPGWKGNKSTIKFNDSRLEKVLLDLSATLYTVNRVMLDAEGKPVRLDSGKNRRVNSGLLLYMQYGDNGIATTQAANRIVEALPELEGFVAPLASLLQDVPNVGCVDKCQVPNFAGELEPMNINCCLLLAVPSGAPGSAQKWSSVSVKAADRNSLNENQTVPKAQAESDWLG